MKNKKIIILGGGPAGIGAAWRLKKFGFKNWKMYEKNNYLGGLSSSFKDDKGFIWDIGGHIYFSQSDYFNKIFKKIMSCDFYKKERYQFIYKDNLHIPYPFQNHIRYLSPEALLSCVRGLIKIQNNDKQPRNFAEFIQYTMGEGIGDNFMTPYNEKIWSWPLNKMSHSWVGERVSMMNLENALENIILKRDQIGWGPNFYFNYPKKGGAGGFWRRFENIFSNDVLYNKEINFIDVDKKIISFKDDESISYDCLISTFSLKFFLEKSNLAEKSKKAIKNLKYNSGIVTGIGIRGTTPKELKDKVAFYFPESKYLFHRMTVQRSFSPSLTPKGCWALAFENSRSEERKMNKEEALENIISFLTDNNFIKNKKEIVSIWQKEIKYFYPIPTLDRDKNLNAAQGELKKHNIYSIGRFGAWKYELGNMDHSFMQGVESINKIYKI